jgi:hypothetical protein
MSNSNIRSFAGQLPLNFLPVKMFFSKKLLPNHSAVLSVRAVPWGHCYGIKSEKKKDKPQVVTTIFI